MCSDSSSFLLDSVLLIRIGSLFLFSPIVGLVNDLLAPVQCEEPSGRGKSRRPTEESLFRYDRKLRCPREEEAPSKEPSGGIMYEDISGPIDWFIVFVFLG